MIQFETLGAVDLRRDGQPVRAVLAQPRRLAILTWLAVSRPRGFQSRDRLMGLFWPDSDQERARNSLRQALHHLRRALGDDAILSRGDREIALNPEMISCDAALFDEAVEAGRLEEALRLYRGEFLPGFFMDGAPAAERFIEEERDRLRRAAVEAAWKLVAAEESRGDLRAAAVLARQALTFDPHDEAGLRRALTLLEATGERVAALRLYDEFVRRLAADLDLEPDADTVELADRLRAVDRPATAPPPAGPGQAVSQGPGGRPDPTPVRSGAGAVLAGGGSDGASGPGVPADRPTTDARPAMAASRRWALAAAVAVAAVMVLGAVMQNRGAGGPAPEVEEVTSIAVLPFVNISGDPANEYLADGLSEELMAALARVQGLRVAGHTSTFSFKGKDVGLDSIGRALRVGHVIEGSVRVTGNRLRIVAALIDARSGFHAWSDTYDVDLNDLVEVEDRIARAIVGALRPRLAGAALAAVEVHPESEHPETHADWLRGQQALRTGGPEDYTRAGMYFRRALERDPAHARSLAGLAGVTMVDALRGAVPRAEGYAEAIRLAERALAIDPTMAEAHGVLGRIAQDYQWDFAAADRHYQRAIDLSPHTEVWIRQRARLASMRHRFDEALALARRAVDLDPLAPGTHRYLGVILMHAGRYGEALQAMDRSLALTPDQAYTLSYRSGILTAMGRHPESIATVDRAMVLGGTDPVVISAAATAYAASGDTVRTRQLLARLEAQPYPSPYLLAEVAAHLGDHDRMFRLLERALAERDPVLPELVVTPVFQPLMDHPRMQRLLERLGLP